MAKPSPTQQLDAERPVSPEDTIRQYLEDNGGAVEAHLDHLLVTFGFDELSPAAEARISSELANVGVVTEPPLRDLNADGQLSLRLSSAPPAPAPADPLARDQDASGRAEPLEALGRAEAAAERHREQLEAARSERSDLAQQLEEAVSGRERAEAEAREARTSAEGLREELAGTEAALEEERARVAALEERVEQLNRSHEERIAELTRSHDEDVARLTASQEELAQELEGVRRERAAASKRLGEALVAFLEERGPVQVATEAVEAASGERDRLAASLQEAETRLDEAERTAADLAERSAGKRARRADLERTVHALTKEVHEADHSAGRQRDELKLLSSRLEEARREARRRPDRGAEQRMGQLETAIAEGRRHLASLESTVTRARAEVERHRAELTRVEAQVPELELKEEVARGAPGEHKAAIADLRARAADADVALERQRARLREAEARLSGAESRLEEEITRQATGG